MNKVIVALVVGGIAAALVTGCTANATPEDTDLGDQEEAAASQDELTASASRLVGAFHGSGNSALPPTFEGIIFQANGDFLADVDTGIRCITTPCPSHARLAGKFKATRNFVRLIASAPAGEGGSFYGRYRYSLTNEGKLSLSKPGSSWTNSLARESSYCGEASDCEGQGLIHVMCVGQWSCSETRSCAYSCGVPLPIHPPAALWPVDRKQLVAETSGGGFTPPPAAGSTCAIGAAKYTFDVATRKLSWTECDFVDWDTPMHPISGSKNLRNEDVAAIDAAMNDVKISQQDICGADKPLLTISVTSASQGTKKYLDNFYSCWGDGNTFVDNIDGVFATFRAIAH
jgi:hypothetical protein